MKMRAIAAALLAAVTLTGCWDYSDGNRTGIVQKFSYKGLICKTWEGEMALPGMKFTGDSSNGNVFEFTVENPVIVPDVQKALESGRTVQLTYYQEFLSSPCRSSSPGSYFITAVSFK